MHQNSNCCAGAIAAILLLACWSTLVGPALAEDWPAFRGPRGDGISAEESLPVTWSADENIRWKIPLETAGNSSPIVSRGRVFLHAAADRGKRRSLLCWDRADGKLLWKRTVQYEHVDQTHKTNPHAASTPVADGQRVVVWHGSAGLHCYSYSGDRLWSRDLGRIEHFLGYASSPVVHENMILLSVGPGEDQFLTALNIESGQTIWKTEEPGGNAGQKPREVASYSTPVVVNVNGKQQMVNNMPTRVVSYDPRDGKILWTIDGMAGRQDLVYTSRIIVGDVGISMAGFKGPRLGFTLTGRGDARDSNRLWHIRERNPQRVGTGVAVDGYVFTANVGPATIECLDPQTGELKWQARTPGGDSWASLLSAAGHIYITTQRGATHVIKPNDQRLEIVETNDLGETTNASIAASDGELFIRTHQHLYCVWED